MKNLSYLIILFFAINFSSCGDMNEFTPTVQDPNAEWKLSYVTGFLTGRDDQITSGSERFEAVANPATGQLVITHYFLDDRRAWFGSAPKDVKIINTANGPEIEIEYRQESTDPGTAVAIAARFKCEIILSFSQVGRGTFSKIPVRVRRTYQDASLFGFEKVNNYLAPTK
jgi:hypothetical protein